MVNSVCLNSGVNLANHRRCITGDLFLRFCNNQKINHIKKRKRSSRKKKNTKTQVKGCLGLGVGYLQPVTYLQSGLPPGFGSHFRLAKLPHVDLTSCPTLSNRLLRWGICAIWHSSVGRNWQCHTVILCARRDIFFPPIRAAGVHLRKALPSVLFPGWTVNGLLVVKPGLSSGVGVAIRARIPLPRAPIPRIIPRCVPVHRTTTFESKGSSEESHSGGLSPCSLYKRHLPTSQNQQILPQCLFSKLCNTRPPPFLFSTTPKSLLWPASTPSLKRHRTNLTKTKPSFRLI